jgi:hypothetical protein
MAVNGKLSVLISIHSADHINGSYFFDITYAALVLPYIYIERAKERRLNKIISVMLFSFTLILKLTRTCASVSDEKKNPPKGVKK